MRSLSFDQSPQVHKPIIHRQDAGGGAEELGPRDGVGASWDGDAEVIGAPGV